VVDASGGPGHVDREWLLLLDGRGDDVVAGVTTGLRPLVCALVLERFAGFLGHRVARRFVRHGSNPSIGEPERSPDHERYAPPRRSWSAIKSAARSANMMAVACGPRLGTTGNAEVSTTKSPSTPRTRQ